MSNVGVTIFVVVYLLIPILALAGWVTHVVVCLSSELWGFLIAGAIFAPIGVAHGWGTCVGFW